MYELLLLLLPVAAASGWWAARRSAKVDKNICADRDPAYFRGLNYLLNEQPDKAIDVFIKLLEVDSETVETHLALGNLFRRRGEADRAVGSQDKVRPREVLDVKGVGKLVEIAVEWGRETKPDLSVGISMSLPTPLTSRTSKGLS